MIGLPGAGRFVGEIGNALLVAEKRKRISSSELMEILEQVSALPVSLDRPHHTSDLLTVSDIGRRYRLGIYDACYLQLAQSRRMALATFDRELRTAAARCGVATLP